MKTFFFYILHLVAILLDFQGENGQYRTMKIALLLSGGVDSSVALRLLQLQGHKEITAFYLKIWLEDELSYLGACPWEEDLNYAQAVCTQAGVPLEVINLQTEYFDRVVQYALSELKVGRTPSPDIFCNQRIKFGAFFEHVIARFDKVASGHYGIVRLGEDELYRLFRAPDPVKDQSYFLSHLSQNQVAKLLFPIGELQKSQVRALAEEFDLPNKNRKDSQGICFLGKIKYTDFVGHYLGEQKGEIREEETQNVLGFHKGYWFHTIGQRAGLGLGNGPWYVRGKNLKENIVYVSHNQAEPQEEDRQFLAGKPSWITRPVDHHESGVVVKLRHGPELIPAHVQWRMGDTIEVSLDRPDRGIAPGQFVVFYQGEEMLGSAMILKAGIE